MSRHKQPARMGRYANLAGTAPKQKKKRTKKTGRFAWFWNLSRKKKILLIAAPILAFLILTPLITYLLLANDIKDPERLMNRNNTGIALTDVNGKAFYTIGRAERRELVELPSISQNMKNALIASEDKDFYKHGGFNLLSIFRALFTRVGGGSTITQQLVKNTLLTDDPSLMRKYQELFMAIAVEQNYSKDQILAMYLNSVFFGENAFGIEEAARVYYGKSPKDLTLAESAMLVGLLPAPNAYSPISGNPEYAKQRQTTVLTRMVNNGYITEAEKEAALAVQLTYASDGSSQGSIAPHFVEMVLNELSEKYGYETVMRSGYQVKTTLDLTAQQALVDSVAAGMPHINSMGGSNASGIVIDPTTGEIRALVGSADYDNEQWGKVNMVTTARQPGSSFKSIYYAAALADGVVTPATILHDTKTDFGGGYTPLNADKKFRGDVTLRSAISQSLNIPSVELMRDYTIEKSITAAKNLGITTIKQENNYGLSLALGSAEVPLIEMSNAYAAFANQGQQYSPLKVLEISDKFGKKTFTATHKGKQAINKEGAFLISSILSDNAARAPIFGGSLTVNGRTLAVKTGTTNDSRDAWTIGYSPQYVVGVWVGNNDNTAMRSGGSDMAGPIWRNTMTKLLAGKPNAQFPVPGTIVQRNVCKGNGGLAEKAGGNTYSEYFMAGALPTNSCNVEPTMISVCETSTGKVISIDETTYDESKHSKDTTNCKPPTMEVCELSTGNVITINKSEFDSTKHSTDTEDCKATGSSSGSGTILPLRP
ncbi:MAG: PBP1A family penicillin-binding protein [Candidatus Saccharimonas sp.]